MHGIAARVLNRIAASEKLKTKFAQRLWVLDEDKLTAALDAEQEQLEAQGVQPKVALALLTVGPLLWENAALMSFIRKNPSFLGVFQDVVDPSEAVMLATLDFNLDTSQQAQLKNLLLSYPRNGMPPKTIAKAAESNRIAKKPAPAPSRPAQEKKATITLVLSRGELLNALKTLGVIRKRRFSRIVPVWLRYHAKTKLLHIGEARNPATATVLATGTWVPAGSTVNLFTLTSALEADTSIKVELTAVEDGVRINTAKGHIVLNLLPFGPESRRSSPPLSG